MSVLRWGILGPGRIAAAFARGVAESGNGRLVAIGSRSAERLAAFGDRWQVPERSRHADYAALCADPEVDAVYVATPHPFHLEHGLMVLEAGKHLLMEKPAGLDASEVRRLDAAARERGLFWAEGYMYLHHPQITALVALLQGGRLGAPVHLRASFCFDAPRAPGSRLFAPALAGGAVYDVGGYVLSMAQLVAGLEAGAPADPVGFAASGLATESGVDGLAMAQLAFAGGMTAELACAVARDLGMSVEITCERGRIVLPDPWLPGREAAEGGGAPGLIVIDGPAGRETIPVPAPLGLYAYEAGAAARAIRRGETGLAWPAIDARRSVALAGQLADWRQRVLSTAPAGVRL